MPARGRQKDLTEKQRKQNRKALVAKFNQGRICIGDQYDKWTELKRVLRLSTHAEVAKLLLDQYNCTASPKRKRPSVGDLSPCPSRQHEQTTSTPVTTICLPLPMADEVSDISTISAPLPRTDDVSDISTISAEYDVSLISDQDSSDRKCDKNIVSNLFGVTGHIDIATETEEKSCSFINPFDLTITLSEDQDEIEYSSDEDYEPSFHLNLRTNSNGVVLEDEPDSEDESSESEIDPNYADNSVLDPGIQQMSDNDVDLFMTDIPYLVYGSCLENLANTCVNSTCTYEACDGQIRIQPKIVASALYFKWVCVKGHIVHQWCSQPILNRRMHSGHLMFASSILLSGSNFQKVSMLCHFLKLPILSRNVYNRIQRTYLIPAVDNYWLQHQGGHLQTYIGKETVILGIRSKRSPIGHSSVKSRKGQ